MDKSYMFWSDDPKIAYKDAVPIPRTTYRCKGVASVGEGLRMTKHLCKLVTDHPGTECECICGLLFNERKGDNE